MPSQYRTKRRVAFSETDMAGIVHFANYFRYAEDAEHEFHRSLGLAVHAEADGKAISWPRVRARCAFEAPLRFEEEVEIRLRVRKRTRKSITYEFRIFKEDGRRAARGSITAVCVSIDRTSGRMAAIAIPDWIVEKLEVASPSREGGRSPRRPA